MHRSTLLTDLMTTFAASAAVVILLAAPPAQACDRIAEVSNVRVGGGPVMVAVYTDEASFMKRPSQAFRVEARAATVSVPLCDITGGELAIMVFQDINANGRMDFNPFGIPNEPYAATGSGGFGPPTWATAKVGNGAAPVRVALSQ